MAKGRIMWAMYSNIYNFMSIILIASGPNCNNHSASTCNMCINRIPIWDYGGYGYLTYSWRDYCAGDCHWNNGKCSKCKPI